MADHLDLEAVAHTGLLEVLTEDSVDEADGWKVLHPGEPDPSELRQKDLWQVERVGSVDTRQHWGVPNHGQHLSCHVDDDLVGIAVREKAGQRTAPGHAV